jgi:luciferase family oxidoreductase group 1
VPIWLLGSSLFSAQLAAALGLPFAFASHFAPDLLMEALGQYRSQFRPSDSLKKPHAMAAVAVFAADSGAEAARLFTSLQQSFVNLRRGTPGPLPPPVDSMDGLWSETERAGVGQAFREAIVGTPSAVGKGMEAFVRRTGIDELMVTAAIFDHAARLRSFEIAAETGRA